MTDFRDSAFELVEDGMVDPMMMLTACLKYMSQEEVADMLEINEMVASLRGRYRAMTEVV